MSIRVENISKLYGSQKAVDNISFSVQKGELVGFLGPNGAGKSTLMKMITGFMNADAGKIFVNDLFVSPDETTVRQQIGYLPENNPLYLDLYVKEYLKISAGFYRLKINRAKLDALVDLCGLGDEQHKKIRALSKGYRQRVGLAQALIHDPSVLILDEPTTGLDPNQLEEIRTLIKRISADKTVLFSTHIMQEVEAVCSRVIIINKGQLVADDQVASLKAGALQPTQRVMIEFKQKIQLEKLSQCHWVADCLRLDERTIQITSAISDDIRPLIFHYAVDNNITLLAMQEQNQSIEQVFRQVTRSK